MSTVFDFVPWVEWQVANDTPAPNIHHAIYESATEFLRRSRLALDTTYVEHTCKELELLVELSECHTLVQLEGVYCAPAGCQKDGIWSRKWSKQHLCADSRCWSHDMTDGRRLTLLPPESAPPGRIAVRYWWTLAAGKPCAIPDWLFAHYAEAIADGALRRLHSNPQDTTAALGSAPRYGALFERVLEEASQTANDAHGTNIIRGSLAPTFYRG